MRSLNPWRRTFLQSLLWLFIAQPTFACPLCDTATGAQVRAGIFNAHFGMNLLVTLAPFPVFLLIGACLYYGFPKPESFSAPLSRLLNVAAKHRLPTKQTGSNTSHKTEL